MHIGKRFVRNLALGCAAALALLVGAKAQAPQEDAPAFPPALNATLEKLRDAALSNDYAWLQTAHLTIGNIVGACRQLTLQKAGLQNV